MLGLMAYISAVMQQNYLLLSDLAGRLFLSDLLPFIYLWVFLFPNILPHITLLSPVFPLVSVWLLLSSSTLTQYLFLRILILARGKYGTGRGSEMPLQVIGGLPLVTVQYKRWPLQRSIPLSLLANSDLSLCLKSLRASSDLPAFFFLTCAS